MFTKVAHIPIIEQIAKGMKDAGLNDRYLELGIARAQCFNVVAPYFKNADAVDRSKPSLDTIKVNCNKHAMITDDYFRFHCKHEYDLMFIDARHKFENVQKDFDNSVERLNKDGLILIHDTYSPNKEFSKHTLDAWKIQPYIRTEYPNLQYINLPFYFGISIVKRNTTKNWWFGYEAD